MSTFEKVWKFDLNRPYVPATALDLTRYTMWLLAAQLTGKIGGLVDGIWTLHSSSDSVTAGVDAVDRWVLAGPYDGTKIVRGATTAVHSWIVLTSPSINGNVWYMILSFNTAADAAIRLSYSKTAPGAGTNSVSPTAVNQWWPNGGKTATDLAINAAAVDSSRFNLGLTSAGDFYFLGCKQAAALPNLAFMFHGFSNRKATDLFPVWTLSIYLATGVLRQAAVATSVFDLGGTNKGLKFDDGATAAANTPVMPAYFNVGSATTAIVWNQPMDILDGTFHDFPVWIVTGSPASIPGGLRGRIADFALCQTAFASLVEGSVSPTVGSIDSCRAGAFWFPANAAFDLG